jgi:transcriptional regulator with XRE-family HTH domain
MQAGDTYYYRRGIEPVPPEHLRLRTRIFDATLWKRYGIRTMEELAERMHVTTGALSRLRNESEREPSAVVIRGALAAFPNRTLGQLFYLEYRP